VTHDHPGKQWEAPITRLSDEQWERVRPVLEAQDPPRRRGRKRVDPRGVLDAIIYRLNSRCPWNALPKQYPDDSSVHRTYQRWQRLGVLTKVLEILEERLVDGADTHPPAAALGSRRSVEPHHPS
jgi:transposase